ncbi:MAG TPA: hypothetical protein DDW65_05545, partial [Firmicutes bacterium]|nr:hypothetical protein [Bacillota bacterium]
MINKISIFVVFIILITLVLGCGGGSGSSGGSDDKVVTNPEINNLLKDFTDSVDAYIVDDMLEHLDDSASFTLTIHEGSYTDTKKYIRLKMELTENDEENVQQTWRESPPDGNGYVLELILGTATSGNESPSGAVVKQTFEVYERAVSPEIPRTKTDSGSIVWTLAQTTGEWKATAMVINYNTSSMNSSSMAVKSDG